MKYVKVCGLKTYNNIQLSINHGATAVGFIYDVPESPRNLDKSKIKKLIKNIPKECRTVLVFKPKSIPEIKKKINHLKVEKRRQSPKIFDHQPIVGTVPFLYLTSKPFSELNELL